jgi:hypothetical protein
MAGFAGPVRPQAPTSPGGQLKRSAVACRRAMSSDGVGGRSLKSDGPGVSVIPANVASRCCCWKHCPLFKTPVISLLLSASLHRRKIPTIVRRVGFSLMFHDSSNL